MFHLFGIIPTVTKFKVAIIGCGGRGRGHAEGYAASKDVKLVACADPVVSNAEALAQKHKIPGATDRMRGRLDREPKTKIRDQKDRAASHLG